MPGRYARRGHRPGQYRGTVAVPGDFELQGVIVNNLKSVKLGKLEKRSSEIYARSLLPKLSRKPDLVVLFSHEKKQAIITESYVAKVPLISFNLENEAISSYALNGLKFLNSSKNLFSFGLNFLFKTSLKKGKK